jgi:hypothetical protein
VADFLRTHCLRLPFQAGRVWWVANLFEEKYGCERKKRHTRYVSIDPFELTKTENSSLVFHQILIKSDYTLRILKSLFVFHHLEIKTRAFDV